VPARPFPPSIFLDKNRRDIGKYQSIWTDSKRWKRPAHPHSAAACRAVRPSRRQRWSTWPSHPPGSRPNQVTEICLHNQRGHNQLRDAHRQRQNHGGAARGGKGGVSWEPWTARMVRTHTTRSAPPQRSSRAATGQRSLITAMCSSGGSDAAAVARSSARPGGVSRCFRPQFRSETRCQA
jgi:hypothetical protein